jgi:aryl-alcohol dehydrogenase-like predicted oxidoreductase
METRELGRSGISVSRVILGCGGFGGIGSAPQFFGRGTQKDEAHRLLDAAWDLGISTLDTADAYGGGLSESFIGEWLTARGAAVRDRVVVTTKTFNPMTEGADRGLSRARVARQIETSLERLGLDRIPLYMTHDWDVQTPIEETLGALDGLVRAGKVGAVGCSNVSGEQLAEALEISRLEGLVRFEWVQNAFSLLELGGAETIFPVCHEHSLGFTPFSPLAGGWLTGKYRRGEAYPPGSRMTLRPEGSERYATDQVFDGLEAFERAAADRGVSMAGLALAWALAVPEVTAVIVGPAKVEHLAPVREALSNTLSAADRDRLTALFP